LTFSTLAAANAAHNFGKLCVPAGEASERCGTGLSGMPALAGEHDLVLAEIV
jgi:hypothetical protein